MTNDHTALRQRVKELESIHDLAQSLTSITDVYATLETIAKCYLGLCRAERGAVVLLDGSGKEAMQTVVRTSRESNDAIDHIVNAVVGGWLVVNRRPLVVQDVIKELNIKSPLEQVRMLGPALAVPLFSDRKMIGLVNLVNLKGGRDFTDDDLRSASTLTPLAVQFIQRAKMHESLFSDNVRLREALQQQQGTAALLGKSKLMQAVRETIITVAPSSASVLLVGGTGTGKEIAAKAIHYESLRAERPFIALNCSAIPATLFESELFGHEQGAFTGATATLKGKFELADQGTLFLDEISAMPLDLQPKLLRILEERTFCRVGSTVEHRVDVRVIAATNKDLRDAIRKGEFREDLYHRLNVIPITLPKLNQRAEDIPLLADAFLQELTGGAKQFAEDAREFLSRIVWKGNVRELRNAVERISLLVSSAVISAQQIRAIGIGVSPESNSVMVSERLIEELRELLFINTSGKDLMDTIEKELVQLSLKLSQGNITQAGRLLGIDRSALQRRIEKFGTQENPESDLN